MIDFLKKYKRKITQLTIAILYNINFLGFKTGNIYRGNLKNFCVPGLNCYSCPGAIASCPIGSFQSVLMQKKYSGGIVARIPFYVIGTLVLFGVIFGRVICGFLCPFGLFQEILYKIKSFKIKKNNFTRKLSYIKYIILIVFVVIIPIFYFSPGFCKYICPAGTLEAGIFHVIKNEFLRQSAKYLFLLKNVILFIIIVMSIFMYRFFCRFICPLGAFYSFFNRIAIFGLKIDASKCTHCNVCTNTCLMDVKKVGDNECIQCGECIAKCKTNAIYRLKKNEKLNHVKNNS